MGSSGLCWGGLRKEELSPGLGPKDMLLRNTQSWEWWPSQRKTGCVGAQLFAKGSQSQSFLPGRETSHVHRRIIIYSSHHSAKSSVPGTGQGFFRAWGELTNTSIRTRLRVKELMLLICGAGERLLRVSWTVRRSNQSILKEINPEYSLEGLMLKLKLQYFGQLKAKNWLLGEDPDAGKDGGQEKGATEDEMVGWHPQAQWTWVWANSRR